MAILWWIVLGALAGWIASMIMGTDEQQGALGNIVVGVLGALVGGFVFSLFGGDDATLSEFNLYGIFVAIIGAVILLWLVKAMRRAA